MPASLVLHLFVSFIICTTVVFALKNPLFCVAIYSTHAYIIRDSQIHHTRPYRIDFQLSYSAEIFSKPDKTQTTGPAPGQPADNRAFKIAGIRKIGAVYRAHQPQAIGAKNLHVGDECGRFATSFGV